MAEKRTVRAPYTGGHRSSVWRRDQKAKCLRNECDCQYHDSSSSSSCSCEFHQQASGEESEEGCSSCSCEFHNNDGSTESLRIPPESIPSSFSDDDSNVTNDEVEPEGDTSENKSFSSSEPPDKNVIVDSTLSDNEAGEIASNEERTETEPISGLQSTDDSAIDDSDTDDEAVGVSREESTQNKSISQAQSTDENVTHESNVTSHGATGNASHERKTGSSNLSSVQLTDGNMMYESDRNQAAESAMNDSGTKSGSLFNQQFCDESVNVPTHQASMDCSPLKCEDTQYVYLDEEPNSSNSDVDSEVISSRESDNIPSSSSASSPGWPSDESDDSDSDQDEDPPDADPDDDPAAEPHPNEPDGGDPEGGGDPDADPDDGDGDSEYSNSSDSDAGYENFSFDNPLLDRIFNSAENRTSREILALIIALSAKQNLDYKTLIGICRIFNVSSEEMVMPGTKEQLWSILKKKAAGIQRHGYCSECFNYLGRMSTLARRVLCEVCNTSKLRKHIKYFITLSIRKQIIRLLSIPGIWEYLQYRFHREKLNPEGLEEIFDGDGYRTLLTKEDGMEEPFDFSYLLNNDGFSVSKSSNTMAHPIFFRINEFTPSIRQKMTLLAGVWLDEKEPDFNLFFQAFVTEANSLSQHGVAWKPNGHDEVISRFFPTAFCMDAKARASVMNFTHHSGLASCPFCEHPGVRLAGSTKFPMPGTELIRVRRNGMQQVIIIPEVIPLRTDERIRADMHQAQLLHQKVHGIKGLSVIMNLHHFDLGYGCSPDDLHPLYIGVTRFFTNLVISRVPNEEAFMREIDRRMKLIRTPTLMSRKPRSITKRHKWKGTEWRNWLLYFAVLCIHGHHNDPVPQQVIDLFALLSKAAFLLSQDSISNDDIDVAEGCLIQFATRFQNIYGPENMRFNVHILLHLPSAVRKWAGLHLHSTFPFESLNGKFKKFVKSPNGAINQIVNRYLLFSLTYMLSLHPELDEEVVEEIDFILTGNMIANPDRVGNVYLFDSVEERVPTIEEHQLLADVNRACVVLQEYRQCKRFKVLFRVEAYYDVEETKSNNSIIYTVEDEFFVIDSIVSFLDDGIQICGMFCHRIEVGDPLFGIPHIMSINNINLRKFVPMSSVRGLAFKMCALNRFYVTPMCNHGEID